MDPSERGDWSLINRRIEEAVEKEVSRMQGAASAGSSGGGMDPWQQSVENRLSDLSSQVLDLRSEVRALRSDMGAQFRWLIGILVVIFLSLLGTMARGFGWL